MAQKTFRLFIGGEFLDGETGETFPAINPATGEHYADVALGTVRDVDKAVVAAQTALDGQWGRMPLEDRLALLEKVADRVAERSSEFLAAEVTDTGKPHSWANRIDIPRGAANFRIFSRVASDIPGQAYVSDTPDGKNAVNYSTHQPLGVVGVICPWNLPLLLMTWKVAPALAAGNTVVVKPSEETPATATLLGEVMNEVGIPRGVYNVVHGFGPNSVGEALVTHPGVSGITFTGESATGTAIMQTAAPHMKRLSFELGGKNPAIVFADADFDEAVKGTARSTFSNCGQVCLCSERVYVERSIFERFVAALSEEAQRLRPGPPDDPETGIGPLISDEHRNKVLRYYQLAREEGAEVVTGGGVPTMPDELAGGFWIEPTVWTGLPEDARCIKEEVFGPVCHVQPFDSEDDAIAMANETEYGLAAAIWTRDVKRAHRVAHQIRAGLVWVNTWFLRDLRTPFGGYGVSGIGREGGVHSMKFYTETRNICVKL